MNRLQRSSRSGDARRRTRSALVLVAIAAACMLAVPASASAVNRAEEHHPFYAWSGSWASVVDTYSSGTVMRSSTTTGSSVTVGFSGTAFSWVGKRGPKGGSAAISLDGIPKGIVSLNAATAQSHVGLWTVLGLKGGYHQLKITALTSVDASGVGGVSVDCFDSDGTIAPVYQRAPFGYPWGTYIVIDKSDYRLYWVRDGWLIKAYPIAHGRKKGWTPNRIWRIDQKLKTAPGGVYGPRKMRLYKQVRTRRGVKYVRTAYGVHGTNQPWVIGTMASHGCIRMYNKDVLELWPQVPLRTMVVTRD